MGAGRAVHKSYGGRDACPHRDTATNSGMVVDGQLSEKCSYVCGIAPESNHGIENRGNYRMDRITSDN